MRSGWPSGRPRIAGDTLLTEPTPTTETAPPGPDGNGSRIIVQLRYMPPGGVVGHVVAKAFGVDPKSHMDDDLARMKSAVETGKAPRDSAGQRYAGAPPNEIRH